MDDEFETLSSEIALKIAKNNETYFEKLKYSIDSCKLAVKRWNKDAVKYFEAKLLTEYQINSLANELNEWINQWNDKYDFIEEVLN